MTFKNNTQNFTVENTLKSKSNRNADFVHVPIEYSDRARDEIKRRLQFQSKKKHSNISVVDSKSTYSSSNISTTSSSNSSVFSDYKSINDSNSFNHTLDSKSIFSSNSHQTTLDSKSLLSSKRNIPSHYINEISLEDALPKTFYDMYSPEILMSDPSNLFFNGRPKFTKRELLDWDLNDIRSLLIIDQLRPEWGYRLPNITTFDHPELPTFKFQLLPLCSSDEFIIKTLVESDLYMEANIDYEFKLTSAKFTVESARDRHEKLNPNLINGNVMNLTKHEWRNIIENYLLNIAVEAQCRFDFKQKCSEYKKWKSLQLQQQTNKNIWKPDMPPPNIIPNSITSKSLLKKTLIKNLQMKNSNNLNQQDIIIPSPQSNITNNNNNIPNTSTKVSLTKQEKSMLWSQCQTEVYQRVGLDWKPDNVL